MDQTTFDAIARRFGYGLTRRDALRGLAAGTGALAAGGLALDEAAARKRRKKGKKQRCKRAGAFCSSNKQCCPKTTRRKCKVASNAGNSDTTCCGVQGSECGAPNGNGDATRPFCCAGFECVPSGSGFTCQRPTNET